MSFRISSDINLFEPKLATPTLNGQSLTSSINGPIWQSPGDNFIHTKTIESLADFPDPIAGVITLESGTNYYITTNVNIGSNVLESDGGRIGLTGNSSELSSLTSTTAGNMITSTNTVVLRWLTLTCTTGTVLNLNGTTNPTAAIDWFGVNFLNCPNVGTITTYSNVIGVSMAFLSSSNLILDGTINTVGFDGCIFSNPASTSLVFAATLTIVGRVRIQFSSFVATGANSSIDMNVATTIPNEQYILFRCIFSGGAANYLLGVPSTDNKASFESNTGINNSVTLANYSMSGNAIPTTIAIVGVYTKILGTTTSNALSERFTLTNNRATYTAPSPNIFEITGVATISAAAFKQYNLQIHVNDLPVGPISQSTVLAPTILENITIQTVVSLTTGDYVELWISNIVDTASVIVSNLSMIVAKIKL